MSDIVQCPFCPRKLQVPAEVLGQQVQCPSCGRTFVAGESAPEPQPPAAPDAALAELYEHVSESQPAAIVAPLPSLSVADEARVPVSRPKAPAVEPGSLEDWRKVRQGINLLYHGLVIGIVTMLSMMCASCGFSRRRSVDPESAALAMILGGLVMLAGLTSVSLHLVGQVFCLRSPLEHRARALARISLPLLLLGLGIVQLGAVAGWVGSSLQPFGQLGDPIANLGSIVMLAQLVVLLLYLRAIALNIRHHRLAVSIRQLIFLVAGIIAAFATMYGAIFAFNATGKSIDDLGPVIVPFACVQVVLALIFPVWYAVVLSELREAVAAYVRRRERQES